MDMNNLYPVKTVSSFETMNMAKTVNKTIYHEDGTYEMISILSPGTKLDDVINTNPNANTSLFGLSGVPTTIYTTQSPVQEPASPPVNPAPPPPRTVPPPIAPEQNNSILDWLKKFNEKYNLGAILNPIKRFPLPGLIPLLPIKQPVQGIPIIPPPPPPPPVISEPPSPPSILDLNITKTLEKAGYDNTLLVLNKENNELDVVFASSDDTKTGHTESMTFDADSLDDLDFLLLPNAWNKSSLKNPIRDAMNGIGELIYEDNNIYYKSEDGNLSKLDTHIFHSNGESTDGFDHAEIVKTDNKVTIAFEDLVGGGDKDFDDLVFDLKIK